MSHRFLSWLVFCNVDLHFAEDIIDVSLLGDDLEDDGAKSSSSSSSSSTESAASTSNRRNSLQQPTHEEIITHLSSRIEHEMRKEALPSLSKDSKKDLEVRDGTSIIRSREELELVNPIIEKCTNVINNFYFGLYEDVDDEGLPVLTKANPETNQTAQLEWAQYSQCIQYVRRDAWTAREYLTNSLGFGREENIRSVAIGKQHPVLLTPGKPDLSRLFLIPALDFVVGGFVKHSGVYDVTEEHILRQFIREGDCVLELGSNIGSYTVVIADEVGVAGTVYAFEPFRKIFHILNANVALQGYGNVHTRQVAFSNVTKVVEVNAPDLNDYINLGAARVFHQQKEEVAHVHFDGMERIEIETLDHLHSKGLISCIKKTTKKKITKEQLKKIAVNPNLNNRDIFVEENSNDEDHRNDHRNDDNRNENGNEDHRNDDNRNENGNGDHRDGKIGAEKTKHDENGDLKMRTSVSPSSTSFTSYGKGRRKGKQVYRSLDDEKTIDFIKIDTEGMEMEVIQGGLELIKQHQPMIYVESQPFFSDGDTRFIDFMKNTVGYICNPISQLEMHDILLCTPKNNPKWQRRS